MACRFTTMHCQTPDGLPRNSDQAAELQPPDLSEGRCPLTVRNRWRASFFPKFAPARGNQRKNRTERRSVRQFTHRPIQAALPK